MEAKVEELVHFHNVFACKSSECCSHTDWSEFFWFVFILMQCHEVVGRQKGLDLRGHLIGQDQFQYHCKRFHMGEDFSVLRLIGYVVAEGVREI